MVFRRWQNLGVCRKYQCGRSSCHCSPVLGGIQHHLDPADYPCQVKAVLDVHERDHHFQTLLTEKSLDLYLHGLGDVAPSFSLIAVAPLSSLSVKISRKKTTASSQTLSKPSISATFPNSLRSEVALKSPSAFLL